MGAEKTEVSLDSLIAGFNSQISELQELVIARNRIWVFVSGGCRIFGSGRNDNFLSSGETYELRNNLVVRPFRTQHAIPSQGIVFVYIYVTYICISCFESFALNSGADCYCSGFWVLVVGAVGSELRQRKLLFCGLLTRFKDIRQAVSRLQSKVSAKVVQGDGLRCLRKVCDSWSLFVEFPPSGQVINRSSCKKRKVSLNGSSFCGADLFALVKDSGGLFLEDECDDENKYDFKHTRENFQKAKECLISLKNSIECLHQKNLFPYNPNALLNRCVSLVELIYGAMEFIVILNNNERELLKLNFLLLLAA
ncbi:uncharacterized protein LOC133730794 [Rosa rugosa]|uniref:uncharacterized protein LOC133730794 n=1 Tax=Rosa rugosa TaxID=74645 RepID=UPI002B406CF3|nr:uncharacterized protein LOC133730794 [Rosa rugosa]